MCDSLIALAPATAAGVTLFAKNSDRPPSEAQIVEWNMPRRETVTATTYVTIPGWTNARGVPRATYRSLIERPQWCWGAEQGVNECGVAVGNHTIYTTADPRSAPDALIGMDLVRLALERASTAAEAVEVITAALERHGQGGSGHDATATGRRRPYWSSFAIADPAAAWMLETSGTTWEALAVESTAAMSNRTCIPGFDAVHRHPNQPVERLVDPRLRVTRAALGARPVTRAAIAQALTSHDASGDAGWSVCMHVVDEHGRGVEATTSSMIAELPVTGRPRVAMAIGSPCRTPYRHFVV